MFSKKEKKRIAVVADIQYDDPTSRGLRLLTTLSKILFFSVSTHSI